MHVYSISDMLYKLYRHMCTISDYQRVCLRAAIDHEKVTTVFFSTLSQSVVACFRQRSHVMMHRLQLRQFGLGFLKTCSKHTQFVRCIDVLRIWCGSTTRNDMMQPCLKFGTLLALAATVESGISCPEKGDIMFAWQRCKHKRLQLD